MKTKIFQKTFIIPFLLMAVFFTGAGLLQHQLIGRWLARPYKFRDGLLLPSSEYVRVLSAGYDKGIAQLLWLRMIQTFAGAWSSPENAEQIYNYWRLTADLDPHLSEIYTFAMMAVGEAGREVVMHRVENNPEEKRRQEEGWNPYENIDTTVTQIFHEGSVNTFGNYNIPFNGAFYAYWTMNDIPLARIYIHVAKKDPFAPSYIDRWEGFLDVAQGRYQAAFDKYLNDCAYYVSDKDIYPIVRRQLYRSINQWFIGVIKEKAIQWHKDKGIYPTFEELVASGVFNGVTLPDVAMVKQVIKAFDEGVDPFGGDQGKLQAFAKSVVKGWHQNELPLAPYDNLMAGIKGFVIWRDMPPKNKRFVLSYLEALKETQAVAISMVGYASTYEHINGTPAPDFKSLAPDMEEAVDPWGGHWTWDPNTKTGGSETYPDILKMKLPPDAL